MGHAKGGILLQNRRLTRGNPREKPPNSKGGNPREKLSPKGGNASEKVAFRRSLARENQHQEEGEDAALAYDATAHDVVGFSFVVGGSSSIPPVGELRFNLKVAGDSHNYCTEIVAPGLSTFLFTDLWQDCWVVPNDTSPSLDPTQIEALHWQYVTSVEASYDFDICISDLKAIVEPD